MNKVLIIGPDYFNFLGAVRDAFAQHGWAVAVEPYDNPVHPYTSLMRLRFKLSRDKKALQAESRIRFKPYIEERFDAIKPDLVFVMNGDILELDTLDRWRRDAKVALWLFDGRLKVRGAEANASHVDKLWCFDEEDVRWFNAHGVPAAFLPQACDVRIYHPVDVPRDIDILFVGNVYYSPKRKETLLAVAERYKDRRVEVWGEFQPWYKGLLKWLARPYRRVFHNRNLLPSQVNVCYNRARVVLNIHQEHQHSGANPRVFEICGSGAYQICDSNPYVRALFPRGGIGLYEDREQLFALIDDALASPKDSEASAARETVLTGHTFVDRIGTVLDAFHFETKIVEL